MKQDQAEKDRRIQRIYVIQEAHANIAVVLNCSRGDISAGTVLAASPNLIPLQRYINVYSRALSEKSCI
jgi:hypothetical protein